MDRVACFKRLVEKHYRENNVAEERISAIVSYFAEKFEMYMQYVDDDFEKRLHGNEFLSRMSELYFVEALLESGLNITHKSNEGLDIWINDIKGWGEFVAATDSKDMEHKKYEVRTIKDEDSLLRMTSVVNTKFNKVRADIAKGLIAENEPVILFLSLSSMWDRFPMNPEGDVCSYLRALFPISAPYVELNITRNTSELKRKYELGLPKNGSSIENDYFLKEENSMISAVVFSYSSIFHGFEKHEKPFKSGEDFVIAHNPLAKNPIQTGLFNCWQEYVCEYEKGKSFTLRDVSVE